MSSPVNFYSTVTHSNSMNKQGNQFTTPLSKYSPSPTKRSTFMMNVLRSPGTEDVQHRRRNNGIGSSSSSTIHKPPTAAEIGEKGAHQPVLRLQQQRGDGGKPTNPRLAKEKEEKEKRMTELEDLLRQAMERNEEITKATERETREKEERRARERAEYKKTIETLKHTIHKEREVQEQMQRNRKEEDEHRDSEWRQTVSEEIATVQADAGKEKEDLERECRRRTREILDEQEIKWEQHTRALEEKYKEKLAEATARTEAAVAAATPPAPNMELEIIVDEHDRKEKEQLEEQRYRWAKRAEELERDYKERVAAAEADAAAAAARTPAPEKEIETLLREYDRRNKEKSREQEERRRVQPQTIERTYGLHLNTPAASTAAAPALDGDTRARELYVAQQETNKADSMACSQRDGASSERGIGEGVWQYKHGASRGISGQRGGGSIIDPTNRPQLQMGAHSTGFGTPVPQGARQQGVQLGDGATVGPTPSTVSMPPTQMQPRTLTGQRLPAEHETLHGEDHVHRPPPGLGAPIDQSPTIQAPSWQPQGSSADRREGFTAVKAGRQQHSFNGVKFPLPSFSGSADDNWEYFVKKLRWYARAMNWGENQIFLALPMMLTNAALNSFEEIESPETKDLDQILEIMGATYGFCPSNVQSEMHKLNRPLRENESCQEMANSMNKSFKKVNIKEDHVRMNFYFNNLPAEMREKLICMKATSYAQMVKDAVLIETGLRGEISKDCIAYTGERQKKRREGEEREKEREDREREHQNRYEKRVTWRDREDGPRREERRRDNDEGPRRDEPRRNFPPTYKYCRECNARHDTDKHLLCELCGGKHFTRMCKQDF